MRRREAAIGSGATTQRVCSGADKEEQHGLLSTEWNGDGSAVRRLGRTAPEDDVVGVVGQNLGADQTREATAARFLHSNVKIGCANPECVASYCCGGDAGRDDEVDESPIWYQSVDTSAGRVQLRNGTDVDGRG